MIRHELLQKFCSQDSDEPREYTLQPFTFDGMIYATNGHIMVRVNAVEGDHPAYQESVIRHGNNIGNGANILFKDHPPTALVPIPEWDRSVEDKAQCDMCDGAGYHDAHEYGTGNPVQTMCDACEDGTVFKFFGIEIGATMINSHYLRLIEKLPNARISPPDNNRDPIPFTFDGGEGLVMPMRK